MRIPQFVVERVHRRLSTPWLEMMARTKGKDMKITTVLTATVLLVSFAAPISPQQERTPTVEQCRAAMMKWMHDDPAKLAYSELQGRARAMLACPAVDADQLTRDGYQTVFLGLTSEEESRLYHFLDRHKLWDQFNRDDAAGLR